MKRILVPALVAAACGLALAKLPAPDAATKAKADETAAKTAWQGKVDAYLTCKVQDKIAAQYLKSAGKAAPTPAKTSSGAAPAASASMASASAPAAAASGTPVAFKPPPPCADPGPFAYNKPEEKPLETSGAHSPAGNANSPPSVKQESAKMAPAKKS